MNRIHRYGRKLQLLLDARGLGTTAAAATIQRDLLNLFNYILSITMTPEQLFKQMPSLDPSIDTGVLNSFTLD